MSVHMPTWGSRGAMTRNASWHVVCVALLLASSACSDGTGVSATATAAPLSGVRYLADTASTDGFARATQSTRFSFPLDHAPHTGYRTEWWYFTGNLSDANEARYGFELTFFRVQLTPGTAVRESALATNEVWMAHLAVTDIARQEFQTAERLSRGAVDITGFTTRQSIDTEVSRVGVEDFLIEFVGDSVTLSASDTGFGIALTLTGLDRIVLQGDNGLDAKGSEPGNASYYFSAPRLSVTGQIQSAGTNPVAVSGSAWMDREWSTSALSPEIAGWDWFALQLDDGSDLMFYRLRGHDDSTSEFSGGSLTDSAGNSVRLTASDVELIPMRNWISPATRVSYPVSWHLRVPDLDIELEIEALLDKQELDLSVRYWEGAVAVSGNHADSPVAGVGYLELAGY